MKLQLLAKFSQQFENIAEIFRKLNISYYLLGAQARDLQLLNIDYSQYRKTNDINFAILLQNEEDYEKIKEEMLNVGYKITQNPIKCIIGEGEDEVKIDLLPFANIEDAKIQAFIKKIFAYSIVGYSDVAKYTELVEFIEGKQINVASVAGIVILKLVAWSEKSERTKDLQDFYILLSKYYDK